MKRAWIAIAVCALLAGCVKRPLQQDEQQSSKPRLAQSKAPTETVVEPKPTAVASPVAARKPKDESGMGEELFKKGDFKRAVAYLAEAVKKDSGNFKLWRNLGAAYAMAEDYDNSLRCFQAALRRNPTDIKTHYNLSLIYSLKGSLDDAEAAAKKGLSLEPENPGLHSSLGNVYADKEKDDPAMDEYKTALRIRPEDPITRFNKGGLHFKRRELIEAEKEYREVLRLKPDDAEAAQNLGAVYILQDRLVEAEKLNRSVIKSKPKDEDTLENAYFNLGLIYDRQNKLEKGLDMYKLALQVAPWDAAAYVNAAVILERLNRKKEALAYWQKYERLFPASRRADEVHKRIDILKKMVVLEADKGKKSKKGPDKGAKGGE